MSQSRTMSAVETVTQNVVGFIIAMLVQALLLPRFGFTPTLAENFWITLVFMAISVVRAYIFRRVFEFVDLWLARRRLHRWSLELEKEVDQQTATRLLQG